MITNQVIKDIYKTCKKPPKDFAELNLDEYIYLLKDFHNITIDDEDLRKAEIIINDLEDMNPFRRFLVRSLHGVLEFDNFIAFVFPNHILFLSRTDNAMQVHFKPDPEDDMDMDEEEKEQSFWSKLFGRR